MAWQPEPLVFDTMMAEWLVHPSSRNLGLKSLAWVRLGIEMTSIDQLIGTGRKQKTMAEVSIADAAPYAAADAEICLRLRPILDKELTGTRATGALQRSGNAPGSHPGRDGDDRHRIGYGVLGRPLRRAGRAIRHNRSRTV